MEITSERQVTLPIQVMDDMGVKPGDHIEIIEGPDGYILKPRRIDYSSLSTLKDKIPPEHLQFDIETFRENHMIHRYGIDTSILVRLMSSYPVKDHP